MYGYVAFNKIFFIVGLVLFLAPSIFGVRDIFGIILGANFWTPLARVSFCMYLVHFFVIQYMIRVRRQMEYYTTFNCIIDVFTDSCITIIVGTILSMLIEAPLLNVEKVFIMPPPKAKKEVNEANDSLDKTSSSFTPVSEKKGSKKTVNI